MIHSCGESNARGVAILLHPNSEIKLVSSCKDENGRIVCVSVKTNDKCYVICNVYAPNTDNAEFFLKAIELSENFLDRDAIIFGGDFNLVMDPNVDRNGSKCNHDKSLAVLLEFMEKENLCDVWRVFNPNRRRYTGTDGRGTINPWDHALTICWFQ